MSKRKTVLLHGSNRNENFGDILLMKIYKKMIEDSGANVIMDRSNEYYSNYLNLKRHSLLYCLLKADRLIYGGGGYFGEPNFPNFRWNIKFLLDHLLPGLLFIILGKQVLIGAVGFGPISNLFLRKLAVLIFKNADHVSVRDEESKNYLLNYGLKKTINVIPDTALTIKTTDFLQTPIPKISIGKILIHFSKDSFPDENSSQFVFFKSLLEELIGRGFSLYFLVDHGTSRRSSNHYREINRKYNFTIPIVEFSTPELTLKNISSSDFVITTKLHVAITSYALGVVPFSIAKHQKTFRFFKQINHPELWCDISLFDNSSKEKILNLIDDNFRLDPDNIILERSMLISGKISEFIEN
ncbi:polysaccharide pyruvyl transferase family protein [Cyclobacterium plantarum]|uniref:polysaccharide pyruvyl transferase family protein n=1 Tax=Cyclobacterium plantarum TaxID=2716263 RepID=UPI003F72861B